VCSVSSTSIWSTASSASAFLDFAVFDLSFEDFFDALCLGSRFRYMRFGPSVRQRSTDGASEAVDWIERRDALEVRDLFDREAFGFLLGCCEYEKEQSGIVDNVPH
jgi:hypothetical protein